VSADCTAAAAVPATSSAAAPAFSRTAAAVLGTMLLLIVALTGVLVQTTWVDPGSAEELSADPGSLARR
jgi:hypothetical protein